jgi:S-layer homology domain
MKATKWYTLLTLAVALLFGGITAATHTQAVPSRPDTATAAQPAGSGQPAAAHITGASDFPSPVAPTSRKPPSPHFIASPDAQTINGVPLNLVINDDTSTAIYYNGVQQFYGGNAEGAYVWYGGAVYGPGYVPAGNTVNPWTAVSNVLSGSGTRSDPWLVNTVVRAGNLQLTQRVTYVNGDPYATYTFVVSVPAGATWTLFHAADLYTEGNDAGYPYYDPSTGAIGGRSGDPNNPFYQYFLPLDAASHYEENQYNTLWVEIGDSSGQGSGFHDTTDPNLVDNMAGLQWNKSGPQIIHDQVVFNTTVPTPAPTNTPQPTATPQPTVCPNPFVDINSNIFFHAINYLYCHGVVNGTDPTHYSPAGTATRGQFAKVVVLGFGTPFYTPTSGQDFTDVPPGYFAYLYIETGFHAGILSGFDAAGCTAHGATYPCYLPNIPITRGQLTKLVVNAAHYTLVTPGTQSFSDVPPSNVFYIAIETAHSKGVINGYNDGTFRPNNPIRRDEMAQIVYKGVTTP